MLEEQTKAEDVERIDEQDRTAWNLPAPPLIPVGPATSEKSSEESSERGEDEVEGGVSV